MAFINTIKTILPSHGTPGEYVSSLAVSEAINGTTSTALTGFVNFVRSGWIRRKVTTAPAASQVTAIKITATDGTTTVTLYQDAVTRTAAELQDFIWPFISELNLTTVTVAVTLANAGSAITADYEISGNS